MAIKIIDINLAPVKKCIEKPQARVSVPEPVASQSTIVSRPVGRPLMSEANLSTETLDPWIAEGMSRATWYRRRSKLESYYKRKKLERSK
jgi:hypothetical protein